MLGFELTFGGEKSRFTSLRGGTGFVNLTTDPAGLSGPQWGRVIFHVSDVDELHARVVASGHSPDTEPRDAGWGERYFHLTDPDGHQLSFARPLTHPRG